MTLEIIIISVLILFVLSMGVFTYTTMAENSQLSRNVIQLCVSNTTLITENSELNNELSKYRCAVYCLYNDEQVKFRSILEKMEG